MSPLSGRLKNVMVFFDTDIDINYFDNLSYQQIKNNGIWLTDYNLIHYASIHYQSRFKNDIGRRFRYTLDTIEPSLNNNPVNQNNRFYFSANEDIELQKQSSEVIGVGFAIALSHKLFNINLNRINKIGGRGNRKRCDFEILKNSQKIIVESKGGKQALNALRNNILKQKNNYVDALAKYGIIAKILRNEDPVSLYIVGPDKIINENNINYIIINILKHYSKTARLSGFYRLSQEINKRLNDIKGKGNNALYFNKKEINYNNIVKLGRSYEIMYDNYRFRTFFAPDKEIGLKYITSDEKILFFTMEENLINILEKQDYNMLLNYSLEYEGHLGDLSIFNNGTFLISLNKKEFSKLI